MNDSTSPRPPFFGPISKTLFATLALCLLAFSLTGRAAAEPVPAAPAGGDGPQLLDKHCTGCHVIEKLTRYRKSKEQWEQTMNNMIKEDGVVLTDPEKTALIDHLLNLKKRAATATP